MAEARVLCVNDIVRTSVCAPGRPGPRVPGAVLNTPRCGLECAHDLTIIQNSHRDIAINGTFTPHRSACVMCTFPLSSVRCGLWFSPLSDFQTLRQGPQTPLPSTDPPQPELQRPPFGAPRALRAVATWQGRRA
eukprot:3900793-Prymnesium_polylepis.1